MFNNTMINEILALVPKQFFKKLTEQYQSDRYKKRFKTWDQLVVMLIGQLSGARSLRDLETILNQHPESYYHLNLSFDHLSRSTLADANQKMPVEIFRDLALSMIKANNKYKKEGKALLSLLDSSPIRVSGRGGQWAKANGSRKGTEGLKLHLQMTESAHIEYVEVTASNVNDVSIAQNLPIVPGRLYVFDKGYCDYNWWNHIAQQGSQFVTRLKENAAISVLHAKEIEAKDQGFILKDQLICLKNKYPHGGRKNQLAGVPLRLIEVPHPSDPKRVLKIVSNAVEAKATEIAGWYKQRWGIELLFKWLKQNLKMKQFFGESQNAITIQIYTAIIAFLLLQAYHHSQSHRFALRLKDLSILVRVGLFARPKLLLRRHQKKILDRENSPQLPLELNYAA